MGSARDGQERYERARGRPARDARREEFTAEGLATASPLERGRAVYAATAGNRSARRALAELSRAAQDDDLDGEDGAGDGQDLRPLGWHPGTAHDPGR